VAEEIVFFISDGSMFVIVPQNSAVNTSNDTHKESSRISTAGALSMPLLRVDTHTAFDCFYILFLF
jgi:hypothetical protein